ncbi:anaerobic sulfatase maturase [Anaerolineae bacterium CFX7]|nr:anaerobic sulfatase maturase [Anaerolineae bacterium CFX7]
MTTDRNSEKLALFPADAPPAFHLLAKPTGAICNLDCTYCFFLSKEMLYPGSRFRMADDLLEQYIKQTIEGQRVNEIIIAWQGGEPTLMGLDFFKRSIELEQKYLPPGKTIQNTIQTNGTLLNDAWCEFFKRYNFLVGLSLDGPREMHDAYRVDKGGAGTFDKVMHAAQLLQKHGVDFNILCTVHARNADHPLEVYRFFRDELKTQFIQFIPIVERATPELLPRANQGWGDAHHARPFYQLEGSLVTERSVRPEQWGDFMIAVFDEWVRRDVGQVFVQMFDAALASWLRAAGETDVPIALCIFAETCGTALALEHNGDLYSCDHFVEPKYRLGNIQKDHMIQLIASDQQRAFGRAKRDTLPRYCRECPVKFACYGECPRNRFLKTPDGEDGLNYLCAGYKKFFTHIDHPMKLMVDLLKRGHYADEVMSILAQKV